MMTMFEHITVISIIIATFYMVARFNYIMDKESGELDDRD